jgi:hypothetical protein
MKKCLLTKLVGTILVERAVDVVSLLIVFIIAIATQANIIGDYAKKTIRANFLSGKMEIIIIKLVALIALSIILFFIFKFIFKKYSDIGIIKKINILFKGVGAGLSSVKNLQNKKAFILHSLFIWTCYAGGTYLGFYVIPETSGLPIAAAFPVLAFASIGMILTPGGIGSYQWFIMEVMVLYGIDEGPWICQWAVAMGSSIFYYPDGRLCIFNNTSLLQQEAGKIISLFPLEKT